MRKFLALIIVVLFVTRSYGGVAIDEGDDKTVSDITLVFDDLDLECSAVGGCGWTCEGNSGDAPDPNFDQLTLVCDNSHNLKVVTNGIAIEDYVSRYGPTEIVTSTMTNQSDASCTSTEDDVPGWSWSLQPGRYLFDGQLHADSAGAPDARICFDYTGTLNAATRLWANGFPLNGSSRQSGGDITSGATPADLVIYEASGTSPGVFLIRGIIDVSTAGTFKVQHAQRISSSTTIGVYPSGSWAMVRRVTP